MYNALVIIGASRPDGILYGFADYFFFSSATLLACSVANCCEENNGLG